MIRSSHPVPALVASLLSLTTLLCAQSQTIVSPAGTATTEGAAANAFPWLPNNTNPTSAVNVQRYMQIHSDLGSGVKVIQKLAFRRNGPSATQAGTRSIDLEISMGGAVEFDKASFVYANNWLATPTKVLARQVINIGPLSTAGNPAPFEIVIPTLPFVHTGLYSLAWDAQIHGNVETPPLVTLLDAEISSATFGLTPPNTGAGCLATGQTTAMSLVLNHQDSGGTYVLGGYVDFAPANAPVFVALGTNNPNQQIPGLCGSLYTDLAIVALLGNADATGFFGVTSKTGANITKQSGGPLAFVVPNLYANQTLYLQAHALDLASTSPLKIANSNGRSVVVPSPKTTKITRCTRLFHTDGLPNAPWAQCSAGPSSTLVADPSNIGYGVVTEFTY